MKKLFIGGKKGGVFALVDDEDYERCRKKSWYLTTHGRPMANHNENGKWRLVFLHRFILSAKDNEQIDHINRNPLDNRKKNLRFCTNSQNRINQPPKKGKPFKGVSLNGKKWVSRIKINQKEIYLGRFLTAKEAAIAYNKKAKELYGEFAWLNPIK